MTTAQTMSDELTTTTLAASVQAAIDHAMSADESILVLGEDVADPIGGVWKTFKGLSTKYGSSRVRSTPIAETAIIGAAIGASLGGHKVIADIMFFDFSLVAADQIINHAAKLFYMSGGQTNVPITITTTVGFGSYGAQHVQSLEALFMHIPGLKVVFPSTAYDAKGLMATCIDDPDPCLFIQHGSLLFARKMEVPLQQDYRIPLGKAEIKRAGDDVTLVTYGPAVYACLEAAEALASEGISAEVLDLRSLSPLDRDAVLESVGRTKKVAIVHHANVQGGPGAELAALIHTELFGELQAPVARLGAPAAPVPYLPDVSLIYPTAEGVAQAARELCQR